MKLSHFQCLTSWWSLMRPQRKITALILLCHPKWRRPRWRRPRWRRPRWRRPRWRRPCHRRRFLSRDWPPPLGASGAILWSSAVVKTKPMVWRPPQIVLYGQLVRFSRFLSNFTRLTSSHQNVVKHRNSVYDKEFPFLSVEFFCLTKFWYRTYKWKVRYCNFFYYF